MDIAPHERPLARIMHEVEGASFKPIVNFETAKAFSDGYVVMEGDWGGQVYLTVPARLVTCTAADLEQLLAEIDAFAWGCNEGQGCGVFFEQHGPLESISGGMGGGATTRGLWVHPELEPLLTRIREILFRRSDD